MTTIVSDAFGRSVTDGWGSADVGGAWTVTSQGATPGDFDVASGVGTHTTTAVSRNTRAWLSGISALDTELTGTVAVDKVPTSANISIKPFVRGSGTTLATLTTYNCNISIIASTGQVQGNISKHVTGTETALTTAANVSGLVVAANDFIAYRIVAIGASPTQLAIKLWAASGSEPGTWFQTITDSDANLQDAGFVGFGTFTGAIGNTPIVYKFDDLLVNDAPNVTDFIIHACGGECAALLDHWTAASGTSPTLQSTYKRSGNDGIRVTCSASTSRIQKTITNTQVGVFHGYLYFVTLPASSVAIITKLFQDSGPDDCVLEWNTTTDKIGVVVPFYGGAVYSSQTIVAGQWYRIDARFTISSATWTIEWAVDGVTQTTYSQAAAAGHQINGVALGTIVSSTFDLVWDDIAISATSGDYPIADGSVGTSLPEAYTESTGYRAAIMDLAPIGYWRLGEASGTTAIAVAGPNGTYEGTPTLGATGLLSGDSDTALTVSGDDNVNLGDQTWFDGTAKWTITGWYDLTPTASYRRFIAKEDDNNWGVYIFVQNSDFGLVRTSSGGAVEVHPGGAAPSGLRFIAGTYGTDNILRLYVDGVQVGESAATTVSINNHAAPLRISGAEAAVVNRLDNGTVDEVAIFDYALTLAEIETLFVTGGGVLTASEIPVLLLGGL